MKPKIAFVGLGAMGKSMAINLVKAKYDVIAFDVRPEPVAELAALGAASARSARMAAERADFIFEMVRDDAQVEAVTLGADGVLAGVQPGAMIVITSTATPSLCRKLAEVAERKGVALIDAPVSGAAQGAASGTLTFMVGGDDAALQKVSPVLKAMGANIFSCGGVGCGQVAKLANNVLLMNHFFSAIEGLTFAARSGMDVAKMRDIVKVSTGQSWVVEHWDMVLNMLAQRKAGGNAFEIIYKDARLAKSCCDSIGIELPLISTCLDNEIAAYPPEKSAAGKSLDRSN